MKKRRGLVFQNDARGVANSPAKPAPAEGAGRMRVCGKKRGVFPHFRDFIQATSYLHVADSAIFFTKKIGGAEWKTTPITTSDATPRRWSETTKKQYLGHPTLFAHQPLILAMKNTDEILESAGETFEYARQYLKLQGDYIRLEAAERISRTTSAIATAVVLGIFSLLVLIMLSLAVAFWLGEKLGSYAEAFLIVAAAYSLLGGLVFFLRKRLVTNPTLQLVLNAFFGRENDASEKE